MGNFPAFFSWSNLRVWCSRSLNWSKMGLPQPDLSFPIPSPFLWAHSWNVSCLEGNLFFFVWFFSFPFFWWFGVFGWFCFIFSKGYIFSLWSSLLWSSSQCDCPSTHPFVFGVEVVVFQVKDEGRMVSTSVCLSVYSF